jgi:hypothetical protein
MGVVALNGNYVPEGRDKSKLGVEGKWAMSRRGDDNTPLLALSM